MSKRKLTRRQAWRVEKIQKERLSRAQSRTQSVEQLLEGEALGREQTGRIVAHYGANLDVEDEHGIVYHCLTRANLPRLVCGDKVIWQETGANLGVIISLVPRTSLLARPDYNKQMKPIAANIDQMLIVAAPRPALDEDLINRYLVAAELTSIQPLIVINKTDMLDAEEKLALEKQLAVYQQIGYQIIYTSTRQKNGLNDLIRRLTDKTSIFVGQSGVGKSSLIKTFIPDRGIRVGELSNVTGLGKHTTTVTVLYHLPGGGSIIDSPGVREFGLGHVSRAQITEGFVEFNPFIGQCKFKDCKHLREPDCAIKHAVETQRITRQRFDSYLRIVKNLT
ncbi:MAG: small ribosomal subunit biogenesis GTPase RsgA [Gammaproteobacteria bacterium]|nr:small ribosomal subunit biogenesis GTPase RsgA [Gammaproteobacteria bacterium]